MPAPGPPVPARQRAANSFRMATPGGSPPSAPTPLRQRVRHLCRPFSTPWSPFGGPRTISLAIPEDAWRPIPYWMDGAADVAETAYTPFRSKPDPVRLIVRRVKPTPGSQLALFASYTITASSPTGTGIPCPTIAATPRSPSETSSTGTQSSPVRPFRRQRRLAGRPGAGA